MSKPLNILSYLFVIVLISCSTAKKEEQQELPEKIVDRIDLVDLDGNKVDIKNLQGKTIVLNYWATWCRPCIAEMPDIDEAAKILEAEDFVFLAASDESVDKIKKYVDELDYSFKFVKSNRSAFDMELMALPTTMIINKKGEIVYNEVGARKWNSDTEIERLRKIAAE